MHFQRLALIVALASAGLATTANAAEPSEARQTRAATLPLPAAMHGLEADPNPNPRYLPPPPELLERMAEKTATVTVNFNPGSCPTGTTTAWSTQARAAFQYAADIWAALLNGDQTIEIDACWRNDLASTTLGSAGPADWRRDFTNAPQSDTWYPIALANQLAGSDLNGGTAEINANFNSSFTWYFGTDGATPFDEYDFVTVVLHELAHGLGFSGSVNYDNGTGNAECAGTANTACWGAGTSDPFIYDRFAEDNGGTGIPSYATPSFALGNAVTSDNVFFDGSAANILNGGNRVELYAPTTWDPGSSYSHLGEVFNDTEHALMTFSLGFAEAIHYPGRVTLGLLQDLGYDFRNLSTVWVDLTNNTGVETGGPNDPFNTVGEGVKAVYPNGTVYIRPGSYNEDVTVIRGMVLRSEGGVAVIGN